MTEDLLPKFEVSILSWPIVLHLSFRSLYLLSGRFFPAAVAHLHAIRARVIPDNRSFFHEQRRLVSKTGVGLLAKGRCRGCPTFWFITFNFCLPRAHITGGTFYNLASGKENSSENGKMHESPTGQFSGIAACVLPFHFPVGSLLSISKIYIAERRAPGHGFLAKSRP